MNLADVELILCNALFLYQGGAASTAISSALAQAVATGGCGSVSQVGWLSSSVFSNFTHISTFFKLQSYTSPPPQPLQALAQAQASAQAQGSGTAKAFAQAIAQAQGVSDCLPASVSSRGLLHLGYIAELHYHAPAHQDSSLLHCKLYAVANALLPLTHHPSPITLL